VSGSGEECIFFIKEEPSMIRQKAIVYVRQSSGKEEESESIELQKRHCLELAAQRNLEVTGVFEDANSSGRLYPSGEESLARHDKSFQDWRRRQTTEKNYRPGLGEAFQKLAGNDYIIVDDLTRLARPVSGSFLQSLIQQKLVENHVRVLTVKDGEVNYEDFGDRLMSDIQSTITDNQIRIQTQKSRDAMRKLRDDGIYPNMPKMFGIEYLGNHQVRVKPEYAGCIRFIFDEVLKCRPYNAIIADLNASFLGLFPGKCCHPSTFKHIVKQPFYCGYMYNSDGNLIPARQMQGQEVITYDVWRNAQEIINRKRGANPRAQFRPHPFTGLMCCGACGSRMVSGFDSGKEFYYCRSGSDALKDAECRGARANINLVRPSEDYTGLKESIRPLLVLGLYKYLDDKEMSKSEMAKVATYESQLAEQQTRLEKGMEIFLQSGLSEADVKKAAAKGKAKIDELRAKVAAIKILAKSDPAREKFYELCNGKFEELLNGVISDGDFELLLRKSVKRIVAFADHMDIETVYGDFRLDRVMVRQYRNFPKFTWRKVSRSDNEKDLSKCVIEVTYIYDKNKTSILNVDFGKMKIYQQK